MDILKSLNTIAASLAIPRLEEIARRAEHTAEYTTGKEYELAKQRAARARARLTELEEYLY